MSSGCELGRNLVRGALWEQNGTMFEEGQAGVRDGDRIRDTIRGSAGHLEALARALPGSNGANPTEKALRRAGEAGSHLPSRKREWSVSTFKSRTGQSHT